MRHFSKLSIMRWKLKISRMFCFTVVMLATLMTLAFQFLSSQFGSPQSLDPHQKRQLQLITKQECRHPDLDPMNPLITKHLQDLQPLKCSASDEWVKLEKDTVMINPQIIKKGISPTCHLTYLVRKDDYSSTLGKEVELTPKESSRTLESDFFKVHCKSGKDVWKSIMAGIHRDEEAVKSAKAKRLPQDAMGLNVLMFGLDSMSRLHFMRKLPKTYKYLTEVLNATVLKGYNIVGDGTPQALIPILTAFTEPELPETRKRKSIANYVNIYPFIWKNFSSHGYVTAFAEDTPTTGIFNYRLKGFNELPTTHYMRSYYVEAVKEFSNHKAFCLNSMPRHMIMLNWLRYIYDVYPDVPKFAFGFHGELSHDDFNKVQYADEDITNFLEDLNNDGILNNTLLLVMSDHGHRFAHIRETQQGKQEERLPFFSITVPKWFKQRYPVAERNLRLNAERLTSPFDIYSTLMTVLHSNVPVIGDLSNRCISLFSEIPKERSCSHIGIEPHWCACLSWEPVSLVSKIAMEISQAVVDYINELTSSQRSVCAELTLSRVTRVEKLLPNVALLSYKKNADADGFVGDFSDNTSVTEVIYQVQLHTFPNSAIYEASVKYDQTRNTFQVREQDISRINMYGEQPRCVFDTHQHLRKYCYCKV